MREDLQVPADADDEVRLGRPRDPTRDAAILTATLDLLGELGYEQVTVRAIAQRAGAGLATIYRRWPTKEDLVAEAVASYRSEAIFEPAPGSDPHEALVTAIMGVADSMQGERRELFPNLIGQLPTNPDLAEALITKVVQPRLEAATALLGALPGVDPDRVREATELLPASVFFKVFVQQRTLTEVDVRQIVDLAVRAARPT